MDLLLSWLNWVLLPAFVLSHHFLDTTCLYREFLVLFLVTSLLWFVTICDFYYSLVDIGKLSKFE